MPLLITNATLVTNTDAGLLKNHSLYIENDHITEIASGLSLRDKYSHVDMIDAGGALVMPGSICAHTHFYGAFARGMAIPGVPPRDFPQILKRLWWPLDKALDKDTVRLSALITLVDAIKHGTTMLFDHHASPNFIDGSLDVIADTVEQAGLRAVLCYEVSDRDGEEKAEAAIAENVRFLKASAERHLVAATFGLHASMTLSTPTIEKCVKAAQGLDTGFHIHVGEHEADEYDSLRKYNKRVINRLADLGVLGSRTIVAHAVRCGFSELDILRESDTWVSHQPRSNMNNGVGAAPIDAMLTASVKVCLGTDGFFGGMWAEWKDAYLLQKVVHRDPRRAPADGIAKIALKNNAALAEAFMFSQEIGKIKVGAVADLIIVDYHPYTPLTIENLPWHIVFGFESSMVRSTVVAGRLLMRDRQLLTLDEKAIAAEAQALAPALWERYEKYAQAVLDQ